LRAEEPLFQSLGVPCSTSAEIVLPVLNPQPQSKTPLRGTQAKDMAVWYPGPLKALLQQDAGLAGLAQGVLVGQARSWLYFHAWLCFLY